MHQVHARRQSCHVLCMRGLTSSEHKSDGSHIPIRAGEIHALSLADEECKRCRLVSLQNVRDGLFNGNRDRRVDRQIDRLRDLLVE